MKRNILLIITIFGILIIFALWKYIDYKSNYYSVLEYNSPFLEFNRDDLYGTDITSLINKAINNNERFKVKKDELEQYVSDEEHSIKIYVRFEKDGNDYPMEKINKVGIQKFNSYFGELIFICKKISYHKNGKISEMYFEATDY